MDLLNHLILGFSVALTPMNIAYCFIGVLVGTLVGVLPGLGPLATMTMLLPITFQMEPVTALIMLAGIYYGAQYGGSTTAILVNLPGESSAVVTCLDGYQMARQGRAGAALAVAAIGSFFAGTFATLLIAGFAPPLAEVALKFGPAAYFSLIVFGLISAVVLAMGSVANAIAMILLGILLGLIGTDVNSGMARFTFGISELTDGIGFVIVAMGVFGFTEVIVNLEQKEKREILTKKLKGLWLTRDEFRKSVPAVLRGTMVGSMLGLLPGGGALLSSFAAYTLEKKISKEPLRFGQGMIEGVAAPESANNAGAQTSFIPLLTLGIPSNPVMALMIGAMMIHNIQPGPQIIVNQPNLFWGLITSMWAGNLLLVIINLPLIGIWVRLLSVPYRFLFPAILLFCGIGIYSISYNTFDIYVAALFGLLGYFFLKFGCEPAPLMLGFILGPMMEEYVRRALLLSRGNPAIFLTDKISLCMLIASSILLGILILPMARRKREHVFGE